MAKQIDLLPETKPSRAKPQKLMHVSDAGETSWMRAKYGCLDRATWREDISKGFREVFRVLRPHGTLIFKWNEIQIKTKDVLALTPVKPVVGHVSGKRSNTHWICFLKPEVTTP